MLADPERQAEHDAAEAALVQMGPDAAGPMLGVLAGAGPEMKVPHPEGPCRVARPGDGVFHARFYAAPGGDPRVCAAAEAALVRLLGHAPSREEASRTLLEQANAYLQRRQAIRGEMDGWATVWFWDAAKNNCVARAMPVEYASRIFAARLAQDAFVVSPDSRQAKTLFLTAILEEAVCLRGLDKGIDVRRDPAARERLVSAPRKWATC